MMTTAKRVHAKVNVYLTFKLYGEKEACKRLGISPSQLKDAVASVTFFDEQTHNLVIRG